MSKLLTVFGATGQQGGALIDYVLRDQVLSKAFKLRGITRDPAKPAALSLSERGVEIFKVHAMPHYYFNWEFDHVVG